MPYKNPVSALQIPELIQKSMESHVRIVNPGVEEILATEQEVYERIVGWVG